MRSPAFRRGLVGVALLGASALALAACGDGPLQGIAIEGPRAGPASPLPPFDPDEDRIVQVVERVRPAVVNVTTDLAGQGPGGGDRPTGTGTGFIIEPNGIVVTNFHVVEGALRVNVLTAANDRFEARVIGGDPNADLAVLKIDAENLPTAPLGASSDLQLGQQVVAVGFALALEGGPTVTSGIVSAFERTVSAQAPGGERTLEGLIQTDAAINPGNSGGPLLDLSGRVVGINTAGVQAAAAENIGFAIGIDRAMPIIDQSLEEPEAPVAFLGVSTTAVDEGTAVQLGLPVDRGALVVDTAPNGPADRAGIESGDVIVAIEGTPVGGPEEVGDVIISFEPEDEIEVTIVRQDGNEARVSVTLGTRPLPVSG